MTVIRILLAIMMITVLPATVGMIFRPARSEGRGVLFAWIYGQICLWAAFLVICVPMVLTGAMFPQVELAYFSVCGAAFVFALILLFVRRKKAVHAAGEKTFGAKKAGENGRAGHDKAAMALWCVFASFVLLQVFCGFYLQYEDGDDAYYVAITSYSKEVHALYRNIPYTGAYTGLDLRHALAPLPVWVGVLADVAGLSGAITAHVVMPILILCMTYGLYYLLGENLMGEEKKKSWTMPLFMSFAALLVTFGGYSIYSAENFLIVRAGQGKAVLANVVIPALVYLTSLLLHRLEKRENVQASLWALICATMTAGCLCSTLGTFLLCVFICVASVCAVIAYRRWTILFGVVISMLMPVVMASLYVALG